MKSESSLTLHRQQRNCNGSRSRNIVLDFAHKKYSCSFAKLKLSHWLATGLFYRCPYYVSGPGNISVVLLSTEGQRALRIHQRYLTLCSEDEQTSYRFGTTWGWVINDRTFILGWTKPLKSCFLCSSDAHGRTLLWFPEDKGNSRVSYEASYFRLSFYV